ncbi:unnamed protein product [Boreogadus saida]
MCSLGSKRVVSAKKKTKKRASVQKTVHLCARRSAATLSVTERKMAANRLAAKLRPPVFKKQMFDERIRLGGARSTLSGNVRRLVRRANGAESIVNDGVPGPLPPFLSSPSPTATTTPPG